MGLGIHQLRAVGGGAKSGKWLQMKADTFNFPISSMQISEAASLGAAMLAGLSIGISKNLNEASHTMVRIKQTYFPDGKQNKLYSEKYQNYVELYKNLRNFNILISKS